LGAWNALDDADACVIVGRLRCSVPGAFAGEANLDRISASFGVTQLRENEAFDVAVARVDETLYRSRYEGCDRARHA
jgi:PleD family two-component response regulator